MQLCVYVYVSVICVSVSLYETMRVYILDNLYAAVTRQETSKARIALTASGSNLA